MAIRFSRQARADLLDLWLAIAQHDQAAADRTVARIERACANLSRYPEIGQAHPEIAPDARVLVVEDWRVIYRLDAATAFVLAIVHGRRDTRDLELTDD